jgi:Phosphoesterase family
MRVIHRAGRRHRAPGAFAAVAIAAALVLALPSGTAATPPTSESGATPAIGSASQTGGRWFDRVFVVVFENKDRSDVLRVPYFADLAKRGEEFPRFVGETHPSQPNYLAMVGGDTFVRSDEPHDIAATNLADLLEGAGLSWTAYEEGLPEPCFTGKAAGNSDDGEYTRAHNPFISFDDIRTNPERCARIVDGERLDADIAAGTLPTYALYAPNKNHDSHDKPLSYSARWFRAFLEPKLADPRFMDGTLVVVTFDESEDKASPIYTVLLGSMITPGTSDRARYDHYSLLRTIEDTLGIGTLGRHDATATPIRH